MWIICEYTHLCIAIGCMVHGLLWWQCGRSSVTPSQLHVWIAKWAPTWCSSIEMKPCDTSEVALTITVQSIEVWVAAVAVPPGTMPAWSTVTTPNVIISVMSGELHAMPSHQAVTCCPYPPVLVPSNSESVFGTWFAHMKIVIIGILGMACKVVKVDSELSSPCYWRQTADLLQAQPVFSLHVSKPILVICPPSLEVHRSVASSLEHGPAPSIVHVTPDREGLPTPWVYGVHSWPSAAQGIGLLAVKGGWVQIGITDCRGDSMKCWWPCSSLAACYALYIYIYIFWDASKFTEHT